jgi:hypothetical protein
MNIGGHLDKTSLSYTVDQTAEASLTLSHERPLYSIFAENSTFYHTLLAMEKGSQFLFSTRAALDTVDHEWTRSYKEYQRLLSIRVTSGPAGMPEMAEGGYAGLDWSLVFRDVIPRRHTELPIIAMRLLRLCLKVGLPPKTLSPMSTERMDVTPIIAITHNRN